MIQLGEIQTLEISKKVTFGFYLRDTDDDAEVLLPGGEISDDTPVGNQVRVFVYKDSEDRLISTTRMPKITLGELAVLEVKDVSKYGAFLDMGLPKELFLPFKEQTGRVEKGRSYLVRMYVDKSGRLCGSMKVYPHLETDSPYERDDRVEGTIYDINPKIGCFVAVDDRFSGLIPAKDNPGNLKIGDHVKARVTWVREDGRLNLMVKEKAYIQMDEDADRIFEEIMKNSGTLDLTDKSSPEEIKSRLNMSKAAFKRGVGRLLKAGKIELFDKEIVLKQEAQK